MLKNLISIITGLIVVMGAGSPVMAENVGKPPVKELEYRLKELTTLETNENFKVKKYDSKDRLEEEFKSIMVWPLAEYYLDHYFEEKNNNVYIIPTEGPTKINFQNDYNLEKLSDHHYKVTQHGSNQLRGDYTLTIHYKYEAGKWVMADRMNRVGLENGGPMPDTASSYPIMMISGLVMLAFGSGMFMIRRSIAR